MAKKIGRKKVNFMIDYEILEMLDGFVPKGLRSDFVNEALEKGISILKRQIAFQNMDKLKKEYKLKMSEEEIIKLKSYGRG